MRRALRSDGFELTQDGGRWLYVHTEAFPPSKTPMVHVHDGWAAWTDGDGIAHAVPLERLLGVRELA